MFIILVYDVNSKRVGNVMKICSRYLNHVQKSVFDGHISANNLKKLQEDLYKCINADYDYICIYKIENERFAKKVEIGKKENLSTIL